MTGLTRRTAPPGSGEEEDEMDRRKWHFDRSINVPSVIAIIMLVLSGLAYVRAQESRTASLEAVTVYLKENDERLARELLALKTDIKDDLKTINAKLDRLTERR